MFTSVANKLLVFDPKSRSVTKTILLPAAQVEISLGLDAAGRLIGLTSKGVYVLDVEREEIVQTARAPERVNCGFALVGDSVYFASGPTLWRYHLPRTERSKTQ